MKGLVAAIVPLIGVGVFLLLYESPQQAALIWGLLIGGIALGLCAALAGLFGAPPRWTPALLCGWVVFISLLGVLLAVGCLYTVIWAGGHVGKPNLTQTKAITTALGAAIGVTATAVYNVLPKMGYKRFARFAVTFRYEPEFPNISSRNDTGFTAGRAAVKDEGGAVNFPASWEVAGSEQPDGSQSRTVVIDGWKFGAVRVRLSLIRQALADPDSARPISESGPGDPGATGYPADDPPGAMPAEALAEAPAAGCNEDGSLAAFADDQVDRPAGPDHGQG